VITLSGRRQLGQCVRRRFGLPRQLRRLLVQARWEELTAKSRREKPEVSEVCYCLIEIDLVTVIFAIREGTSEIRVLCERRPVDPAVRAALRAYCNPRYLMAGYDNPRFYGLTPSMYLRPLAWSWR
jgi:hypothetical protein